MPLVVLVACHPEGTKLPVADDTTSAAAWTPPEMDCAFDTPRVLDPEALPTMAELMGPRVLDYVEYAFELQFYGQEYGCPFVSVEGDVETYSGDCESVGGAYRGTATLDNFWSEAGSASARWDGVYWAEAGDGPVEVDGSLDFRTATMTIEENLTTATVDGRWSYRRLGTRLDGSTVVGESAWFTESEPADGPPGAYCYAYAKPMGDEVGGFAVWADHTLAVTLTNDSGCGPATFDGTQMGDLCI